MATEEENRLRTKERKARYYLENKETINTRNQKWHKENKEKDDVTKAAYYQENKEELQQKHRENYYKADPEKRRATVRKHYASHKEEKRQYSIDYRHAHPEKSLVHNAKTRASQQGLPFNIDESDVVIPEFCPILGIPLKKGTVGQCEDAPSLDKVNPSLGYVKGNVAVISKRANTIKSYGNAEDHERIAAWMRKHEEGLISVVYHTEKD